MGRKRRSELYLSVEVEAALVEYARRHHDRFRTTSQAAEHLLRRALLAEVDEGTEGLLAPLVERRVEEAAARAIADEVAPLLRAQTNRLAGLLVRSGKDALGAYTLATALLEQVTGDPARARRLAEEARLRAGAAYTARGLAEAGGED